MRRRARRRRRTRRRPGRACPAPGSRRAPRRALARRSRCGRSNTRMNSRPMILRFCSGSVTPASASRNRSRGVDGVQVGPGGRDEVPLDLPAAPRPAAARGRRTRRSAGRRWPAGRARRRPRSPPRRTARRSPGRRRSASRTAADRLVDDRRRGPARGDAGDLVQEPAQHLLAVRGVADLGVVLHAGQPPLDVLERRRPAPAPSDAVTVNPSGAADDASRRGSSTPGAGRAAPSCSAPALGHGQLGAAVLAGAVRRHLAAERPAPSPGSRSRARAPGCPR